MSCESRESTSLVRCAKHDRMQSGHRPGDDTVGTDRGLSRWVAVGCVVALSPVFIFLIQSDDEPRTANSTGQSPLQETQTSVPTVEFELPSTDIDDAPMATYPMATYPQPAPTTPPMPLPDGGIEYSTGQPDPRHCAFVDSQNQISVGHKSMVSLNLEQCVEEVLQRVTANSDLKIRELILTGRTHADATLIAVEPDGMIVENVGQNSIQPLWPQPSWTWSIEPTRAGRHEMIIEITSVDPGTGDPGLFVSPPILLRSNAADSSVTFTTLTPRLPTATPATIVAADRTAEDAKDDINWGLVVGIGGLIFAAISIVLALANAVLAYTGPKLGHNKHERHGSPSHPPPIQPQPESSASD